MGVSGVGLVTGEKTLKSSAGSMRYPPEPVLSADTLPDFMALVIVGTLFPVLLAASFALSFIGLHSLFHAVTCEGNGKGACYSLTWPVAGRLGSMPANDGCETGGRPGPAGI